jgi:hypothetical protein
MAKDGENLKLGLVADVLRCRGTVRLTVRGTSMLPWVWPGDLLTIQSAGCDVVVPGDIVLVLRSNRFFVHRLVEGRRIEGCLSWITRGDAMPHNDPPTDASDLLGRVASIRRANRSFVPSRRFSQLDYAAAWTLWHWDRFCSLMSRIHSELLLGRRRRGRFCRGVLPAVRGILDISPSGTFPQ